MMTDQERIELQQNNPLHGLKLDILLQELVDYYGWDILDAAMRFNCFHTNPSIASSVKYLKKTDWAREKLENFYLYRFKRMPRASAEEYDLSPRARTFPHGLQPKQPMALTVDSILKSQAKAASSHKERAARERHLRR
ncbi:DNA-binding protein VF530 [Vibrio sp. V27_P1S3P104]|nr:DNA-binding protein VF530 [Vibrio sp. V28_P6S34P95]NAX05127.1 DNA-binding protein VF530 [Vibrio sp. V30_P3S12P165]NAX34160.1 DNA-binding protein VF530 [Vibrio sp. V29_P1S30P107]NAX37607.1 DNA-binding protein VF530 [Vibrio sp. V27_P1S3P104]NAX41758.1 DNA-binding protein VF530 [Vibrio sp. V26_P1S5P106]NNN44284.1 DNA-binding protein VF530 [Vibrio sp. 1-1(7)]NNN72800.1 DNA-binding protein VF530 [Vibrio sp. 12-2(3-a)]